MEAEKEPGKRAWPAEVASTLNAAFATKQGLEDQHVNNGASLFVPISFPAEMSATQMHTNGGVSGALSVTHTEAITTLEGVRKITPREAERLQGFPDDYTLIPYKGRMAPDAPRYKALGNTMSVNVMDWIGSQIDKVEKIINARA